ncbi:MULTISPECIES: hypothetical protein [unclassified Mesorhizobium]|uniref:hypothetical protein n=2 Tax=unclassified Mesorhizobium TaxID=325217 RepID=UPI0015E2F182|nr:MULTISPECIES: hypothetical protein [unclassified Mesorhizobium]MBZ9966671.1 hypothetical protein [Mesorhizobium sp. BR1-1-2]
MHAFGLEETGDYGRAEEVGRLAVALQPLDCWAHHAVAHVMEMQGRAEDGIGWMIAREPHWSADDNFFRVHNWWHRSLCHLDLGQADEALHQRQGGPPAPFGGLEDLGAAAVGVDDVVDFFVPAGTPTGHHRMPVVASFLCASGMAFAGSDHYGSDFNHGSGYQNRGYHAMVSDHGYAVDLIGTASVNTADSAPTLKGNSIFDIPGPGYGQHSAGNGRE